MKTRTLFPVLVAGLALTSCRHKDIDMEPNNRCEIYVAFDWQKAPDANPTSMIAYFYPVNGGEPLLYTFAGRDGGRIGIPYGGYAGIGINGDFSDWAATRHTEDPDHFEVYTRDAETMQAMGMPSRAVPRAAGAEDERMAKTPGMMWSGRRDGISIDGESDGNGVQTITFYPDEAVCYYTVDVLDIKHSDYLRGAEIDATLSGMAEGYLHGKRRSTDVSVTMPFTLKPGEGDTSLSGQFLTFGECDTAKRSHLLTVYVILTDGTKWYHAFDVTDQVTNAPDPRHVHIVVRGLDLPQPVSGGSGFRPDVNEWNDININLSM
ncbi:MAG: DUF5119 domain-containing protein [Muribaculaceae bacterium]|nr:DUF5119 domain-containing protein [Muribaculaceae bacterium]